MRLLRKMRSNHIFLLETLLSVARHKVFMINSRFSYYNISYYKLLMQLEFGDFKGCDVVVSDKDEYYKIDGQYYKNKNSLKEYNDAIICRDEAIYRLKSGEYSLGNDISMQFLEKTNKKELYVKNKLIYKNKKGYVDEHISTVTRDEILLEIQMLIE